MEGVTIVISVSGIKTLLRLETEYLGAKRLKSDPESYRRIALISEDGVLMEEYIRTALPEITAALKEYGGDFAITQGSLNDETDRLMLGGIALQLRIFKNQKDSDQSSGGFLYNDEVKSCIEGYLVNSILGQWLLLTAPEESERYQSRATGYLENTVRILNARRRPFKPENYK